jgi:hypothetical protein
MKQFLLSGFLIVSALFSQAQTANFDDGQPLVGWETTADLSIQPYNASPNCAATNPGGLVVAPIVDEPVRILSPVLGQINSDQMLTLAFNYYTFNDGNPLNCANQVNSSCATLNVYVVDANYTDLETLPSSAAVFGMTTVTNLATGGKSINVPVTATIPTGSAYKVVLDINLGGCGALAYVVDDVIIDVIGETVTPVSFKSFNASRNKSTVSLNWTTASEQNNRGFYVQRNNGDGWKDVAFVFSQADGGNSASDLDYAYNDVNNSKGLSQYRLLQVDIDGKAKLSEIRSVRGEEQAARILVYPNPSNTGSVNVVFDNQATRDVQVSDLSGRLVKKYNGVVNNLQIQGLRAGVYTLRIADRTTGATIVEKVVVK